jgi:hypothetical protein
MWSYKKYPLLSPKYPALSSLVFRVCSVMYYIIGFSEVFLSFLAHQIKAGLVEISHDHLQNPFLLPISLNAFTPAVRMASLNNLRIK